MRKNGEATLPPTHTWWSELNNGVKGIVLIMTASIAVGIGLFVLVRTSDDPKGAATLALGGTLIIVAVGFICNTCLCLHTCMRVAQVYDLRHWEVKKAEFDAKHDDFDWLDLDEDDEEETKKPAKVVAQQPEPAKKPETHMEPDEERRKLEVAIAQATERILSESAKSEDADTSGAPKIGDTQELPDIRRQSRNVTAIFDPKASTQRLPDTKSIQEEMARREQADNPDTVATATAENPPCTALAIIKKDPLIEQAVLAIRTGKFGQVTTAQAPVIVSQEPDLVPKIVEEDFETYLERKAEELRIPISCLRSKLMAFNCEAFDDLPAYAQDDLRRLSA